MGSTWSEILWTELGMTTGDWIQLVRIGVRLLAAVILAGVVGLERELRGEQAGLRTHMLVSLGAALFTVIPLELAEELGTDIDTAELVKGIASGIGFLGAGAILKLTQDTQVRGLTTAASIWATAAVGMSAGAGAILPAVIGTFLCWFILKVIRKVDDYLERRGPGR